MDRHAPTDGGLMDAILTRRSIRKYTDQPVSEDLVTDLLRAAMAAPSAGNQQPWQFVVVRDRAILDLVAAANPYGGMARQAQLAVIVCGDLERENREGFWIQDCAAATQNLLLAAHAAGLGAVWCGTYPREERVQGVRAAVGLPEQVIPFAVVPIGYPAERPEPGERYDPGRVHFDRW
jgi:nitroreductase